MKYRMRYILMNVISFFLFLGLASSCSDSIVPGDKLSKEDIKYIQALGLLESY